MDSGNNIQSMDKNSKKLGAVDKLDLELKELNKKCSRY